MVQLAETLWGWDKFREQWRGTDVLLVDEISMVGADLLEKVRAAATLNVCSRKAASCQHTPA